MARSSENVPMMLGGNRAVAAPVSLRRPAALRLAEFAVLLLRATALALLLSPALIVAAFLLG
ncbi:MAG: hypothetical protein QJR07_05540 [Acetobacteraceae bacterium]|nr:hypothetical protein [Acetobacteraceae bacterium]MDI3306548.1 hypothetical protein [Acetobacteraceae bacterium]